MNEFHDKLASTLPGRLAILCDEHGPDVGLRDKQLGIWQEISWQRYFQRVETTGRMLWELGVRQGDRVAILSDNRPEWLYADLGTQGIGAQAVGIYQTNPESDVAYVLAHSQSRVLFCEDQEQVDKALAVTHQTPHLEHIIVIDPRGTRDYQDARLMTWDSFLERGEALVSAEPGWFRQRLLEQDPAQPSMVVYTSGTTGEPKGAQLAANNVIEVSEAVRPLLGVGRQDALLSYLPLCHVAEKIFSLFLPLVSGAVVHFGESIDTVRDDLREVSPTVFLGVPRIWEKTHAQVTTRMQDSSWLKRTLFTFFLRRRLDQVRGTLVRSEDLEASASRSHGLKPWSRLMDFLGDQLVFRALQERLGLRRCRLPLSGAAPISADLLLWFHAIGVPVAEGYGMTESAGMSHVNPPGAIRMGSVGPAVPGTECRIADDGEVLMRGSHVFQGYLDDPEATRESIDEDGWLHTGDIGALDGEGYLRITGRKKEILITAGGKNLSPEKIENALKTSIYIREAVAIGDRRRFVSALIQVDYETTGKWAAQRAIPYTDYPDLAGRTEVRQLLDEEVRQANDLLAKVEQVRKFAILTRELHQDEGELTATQKVRRRVVLEKHSDMVEELYR
ncbi:MAG: long-chain fatty acid--CoA ligase [Deltaproteobacteria bacterium]|nr:long-chain fatty acid--CoA ligase [Deltaproteobacteria bacterium]